MKLDITIPTDLSEITLRQYKHFLKIQKSQDDENFLSAKIIEIFCKVKLEDVMQIKFNDREALSMTFNWYKNFYKNKDKKALLNLSLYQIKKFKLKHKI